MNNIRIRQSGIEDIDIIRDLSEQTFVETFADANFQEDMQNYIKENLTYDKIKGEISTEYSLFFLAEVEGAPVAYMKLNLEPAHTEVGFENSLEVQRLYVLKEYKNMKIGSNLMEKAIESARKNTLLYIWLGVWERNENAIAFYIKNGYEKISSHTFMLGDDEQTDYIMRLNI